jgi:heme-degrading monooxygenase HmoA
VVGRLWKGWTTPENARAYVDHLQHATLPSLRRIDGHEGAFVLRREEEGEVEFVVLTLWRSLDAVRTFAGERYETAVVPPDAQRVLERYDDRVSHYDVAVAP